MSSTGFGYSSAAVPTTLAAPLAMASPGSTGTVELASAEGLPDLYPCTVIPEWDTANAEVITLTQPPAGTGPYTFANAIRGDDGTLAPAHSAGASTVHGPAARDLMKYGHDVVGALWAVFGVDPAGVNDSAAGINAALAYAEAGQAVYVPGGFYRLDTPVVIPPRQALLGTPATSSISASTAGTVFQPSSSFSAGGWPAPAAAILIVDQTTGSYSVQSQEQHVANIMIDGSNLAGSSNVAGICIYSGASTTGQTSFDNVLIYNTTGWGFCTPNGTGQVRARNVILRRTGQNGAANAGGFQLQASDSNWLFCEANSTGGIGWDITDGWDSSYVQCHSEHNADDDLLFTATNNNSSPDAGSIAFHDFTVDAGEHHGIHLTSTGSALPPVTFTGGFIRRCGTSGGTYAGVCVDGYFGPVNLTNMQVYPGLPDGGGGSSTPNYALSLINNGPKTSVAITGGVWIGNTAWLTCDGSQGQLTVSPDTIFGTGQGSSTVTYTPGVPLQAAGISELLPVDVRLFAQPGAAIAATMDRGDVQASFSPSSGIPFWHLVTFIAGVPVTDIWTWVTGTGKTGGTHGWAAVVSVATGKVVAVSADLTDASTSWGSTQQAQPVLIAGGAWTPAVTGAYWVGACITATGMPTVGANGSIDASVAAMPPVYCGTSPSHPSPPSVGDSITITAAAAADVYFWAT